MTLASGFPKQWSLSIKSMQTFTALPPLKGMWSPFLWSPFLLLLLQTCFVFPTSAISISHSCLSFLFPPLFIFVLSSYRHQDFHFKKSVMLLLSPCSFCCFIYLSWFFTVLPSTLQSIYYSVTASFFHYIFRHSCSLFPLTPKFHICCWCVLLHSSSCQYARRAKVFPQDRDELLLSRSKMLSGSTT